jgi:alpha-glucosidase
VHLGIGHGDTVRASAAGLPELVEEVDAVGVRLVSGVGPGVPTRPGDAAFDEGAAAGFFVRDARGRMARGEERAGEVVYPDFTDPRARVWWGGSYQERLDQGFAGFWHGVGRPGPLAPGGEPVLARSARHDLEGVGGDQRAAHNVYGLGMARAAHEGLSRLRPEERPFLLTRSGWAGVQRHAGVWCGPLEQGWAGPRAALSQVLSLGVCGVPFAGPDVGADEADASGVLYVRTLQLAAHLPLLRTRGSAGAGGREPWEFGDEVLEHARAALDGRRRLLPYFTTLAHLARRSGAPYVRPVWWNSPGDRALRDCEDAFLLGDCLLVAPVLAEGVVERTVRLPRGRWYDTFTERAYEGPGKAVVEAPLSRIPVLARAGAVLPVRGADGVTELEAWAPAYGRTGGGVLVEDTGHGWTAPEVERYVTRRGGKRVIVAREGGEGPRETSRPVRIRGL